MLCLQYITCTSDMDREGKKELCWWITNIKSSLKYIHVSDPDIPNYTDSSTLGWVATDGKKPKRR